MTTSMTGFYPWLGYPTASVPDTRPVARSRRLGGPAERVAGQGDARADSAEGLAGLPPWAPGCR